MKRINAKALANLMSPADKLKLVQQLLGDQYCIIPAQVWNQQHEEISLLQEQLQKTLIILEGDRQDVGPGQAV